MVGGINNFFTIVASVLMIFCTKSELNFFYMIDFLARLIYLFKKSLQIFTKTKLYK